MTLPIPMEGQAQECAASMPVGAAAPSTFGKTQSPLGPHPAYDELLDLAIEYTFPASDPIAVGECCHRLQAAGSQSSK